MSYLHDYARKRRIRIMYLPYGPSGFHWWTDWQLARIGWCHVYVKRLLPFARFYAVWEI